MQGIWHWWMKRRWVCKSGLFALCGVEWRGRDEKKGNINKRILYGTRVLFVFGFRAAVSGRWSCLLAALTGDIPWMNNSTTHALASLISLACLGGWCALLRCSGPIMRDRSLSFSLIRALLRFPSCWFFFLLFLVLFLSSCNLSDPRLVKRKIGPAVDRDKWLLRRVYSIGREV